LRHASNNPLFMQPVIVNRFPTLALHTLSRFLSR